MGRYELALGRIKEHIRHQVVSEIFTDDSQGDYNDYQRILKRMLFEANTRKEKKKWRSKK